jgi:hypothetical protein
MPVKQIDRPSGDQVGLKISSTPGTFSSRSRSPLWASKIARAGRPLAIVAIASRRLSASQAPAE